MEMTGLSMRSVAKRPLLFVLDDCRAQIFLPYLNISCLLFEPSLSYALETNTVYNLLDVGARVAFQVLGSL